MIKKKKFIEKKKSYQWNRKKKKKTETSKYENGLYIIVATIKFKFFTYILIQTNRVWFTLEENLNVFTYL